MGNLRDAIRVFREQPRKIISVTVPDIDEPVILQRLKYGEWKSVLSDDGTLVDRLSVMLTRMIVNNDGGRIFEDHEIIELDELPSHCMNLLIEEANKLNGFTKKATEDTIKNSVASPNGASVSA